MRRARCEISSTCSSLASVHPGFSRSQSRAPKPKLDLESESEWGRPTAATTVMGMTRTMARTTLLMGRLLTVSMGITRITRMHVHPTGTGVQIISMTVFL
jgi:hypothetical protein